MPKTIETPHLILRTVRIEDVPDIYAYAKDEAVARFMAWEAHKSVEETTWLVSGWIAADSSSGGIGWTIELKETGKAVGAISLWEINHIKKDAEISYSLYADYWSRGLMTEACVAVIRYAFDNMGLERLRSKHHEDNPASGRVMVKAGMRYSHSQDETHEKESISGIYKHYIIMKKWVR